MGGQRCKKENKERQQGRTRHVVRGHGKRVWDWGWAFSSAQIAAHLLYLPFVCAELSFHLSNGHKQTHSRKLLVPEP